MHRGLWLSQIVLILFGLAGTVEAAKQEHQHHNADVTNPVCDTPDILPSIRCAKAPSVAFDDKGRLWVAWVFGSHVYVNYSDDKGKTYSAPVVVNSVPENIYAMGENRPKVVIGNRGYIYISWTQKLSERFSGNIRFSRSADGGKHFFDPITVNDHKVVTGHRFDAMVVNKRGDIYVTWLDKRDLLTAEKAGQAYNGAALYYALSIDGGRTFNANEKIIDYTCQCCRIAMEMDRDELPVILWRHIFGDNIRDHAMMKFERRTKVGEIVRVSHDQWQTDACPHHGPDMSIANDGAYHLVWFNNGPEHHGLFYARTEDKGKTFSTPLNFGNYKSQAAHPQVLSHGNTVFIAWKEFNGKQATLIRIKSTDAGQTWSASDVIATTTANSDHPLLVSDSKDVYAVWHRRGQDYQLFPLTGH